MASETPSSTAASPEPAAASAEPVVASLEQIKAWVEAKEHAKVVSGITSLQKSTGQTSAWQEAALAQSAYETKDFGLAVIHSQNLVLLNRGNQAARSNLQMAQAAVPDGLGQSMSHPADWGFELSTWLRPKESLSLAFLVLNGFLLLRFFKKPHLKRDLGLGIVVLCLVLMSGLGFYGENIGVTRQNTALRQRPLASATEIRALPAGSRARKIRNSGDFVEIELSGSANLRGWVSKSDLHLFY